VGQLHALVADQYFFLPSNANFVALSAVTDGIPYFLRRARQLGRFGSSNA